MSRYAAPSFDDILAAADRIRPHIHRTPILTSETLSRMTGAELYFKCENFQKVGAFKFRGAVNAVFSLSDEELSGGVATHSSGNHAQAIALAARMRGVPAYIVMPKTAPRVKVDAVRGYGAEIIFCYPTQQSREEALGEVVERTGACFIHPYDNPRVIAGQGTCACEVLQELPDLDIIMTPVGGGGLLSGTAIAARHISPKTAVIAGEPAGAQDAYQSLASGNLVASENPVTIADGLLTSLGKITFPIIRELVSKIVLADDAAIVRAMRLVWERMKVVIEPSAAVPLAAILSGGLSVKGKRVCIVLSGGNVDLERLPWMSAGLI
jgi:threonine dehydratase